MCLARLCPMGFQHEKDTTKVMKMNELFMFLIQSLNNING